MVNEIYPKGFTFSWVDKVTAEFRGGNDFLKIFLIQYVVSPEGEGPIFCVKADIEVNSIVGITLSFTIVTSTKSYDAAWRKAWARRRLCHVTQNKTDSLVSG